MAEPGLFDEAKLAEIVELMGDELATLVDAYATSGDDQISRMRHAGGAGNADALAHAAHQLKGSAGNLGAAALYEHCETMERAARAGDAGTAATLVERIEVLYGETLGELRRIVRAGLNGVRLD